MLAVLVATAITIVGPGDTRVLQLFGRYVGTVRSPGLKMTLPLDMGRKVSVKVRNFETHELKVNDADGNPVNIATIIVWQVADTAKAVFAVKKYTDFVEVQSESALRHVAFSHPYDNAGVGLETLRGSTDLVAAELRPTHSLLVVGDRRLARGEVYPGEHAADRAAGQFDGRDREGQQPG